VRKILAIIICLLTLTASASTQYTIFVSNNTKEIPLTTAFERLHGQPQEKLRKNVKEILAANKWSFSSDKNILGVYTDKCGHETADNTLEFTTSKASNNNSDIWKIATQLDNEFDQDSVLVFKPESCARTTLIIIDTSKKAPVKILSAKKYLKNIDHTLTENFSIIPTPGQASIKQSEVKKFILISSEKKLNEFTRACIKQKCSAKGKNVKAWLVYKNGDKKQLT
jgi:hypothetical protein